MLRSYLGHHLGVALLLCSTPFAIGYFAPGPDAIVMFALGAVVQHLTLCAIRSQARHDGLAEAEAILQRIRRARPPRPDAAVES